MYSAGVVPADVNPGGTYAKPQVVASSSQSLLRDAGPTLVAFIAAVVTTLLTQVFHDWPFG